MYLESFVGDGADTRFINIATRSANRIRDIVTQLLDLTRSAPRSRFNATMSI